MRTPVEGAAGIGYVMRAGYDLPPLNFDIEEGFKGRGDGLRRAWERESDDDDLWGG